MLSDLVVMEQQVTWHVKIYFWCATNLEQAEKHFKSGLTINQKDSLWPRQVVCRPGHSRSLLLIWVSYEKTRKIEHWDRLSDRDGTIDMVFTTCESVSTSTGLGNNCAINIAYNRQIPLCTAAGMTGLKNGQRVCRPPDQLCSADPDFQFDLTGKNEKDVRVMRIYFCLFNDARTLRH